MPSIDNPLSPRNMKESFFRMGTSKDGDSNGDKESSSLQQLEDALRSIRKKIKKGKIIEAINLFNEAKTIVDNNFSEFEKSPQVYKLLFTQFENLANELGLDLNKNIDPSLASQNLDTDNKKINTKIEAGEDGVLPFMGQFDLSKRVILTTEFNGAPGEEKYDVEDVLNWGREEIVQALYSYFVEKATRLFVKYKPFGEFNFKSFTVEIKFANGDSETASIASVLRDLGGDSAEIIGYKLGALEYLFRSAWKRNSVHNRQELGTIQGFLNDADCSFERYSMEGLFTEKTSEIELRPMGVPMSMAEGVRMALSFVSVRGLSDSEKKKQFKAMGCSDKLIKDVLMKRKSPFEHTKDPQVMENAVTEISEIIFKEVKRRKDEIVSQNKSLPEEERENLASDEDLQKFADTVTILMMNFGEIEFYRALHDHGASRYEDMDASTFFHFRACQDKTVLRNKEKGGRVEQRQGATDVNEAILPFFERVWLPAILRYRFMVHFAYKNEDGSVGFYEAEKSLLDIISQTKKIDLNNGLSLEDVTNIVEKINMQEENIDLGDSIRVPDFDKNIPFTQRAVAIESLENLIKRDYPADPRTLEDSIINHVDTMTGFLKEFKFDPASLLVKQNRAGGGSYYTYSDSQARFISKMMRSALYYWINDNMLTTPIDERKYNDAVKNSAPPVKRDGESDEDFSTRKANWQEIWANRGLHLRGYKRDAEGIVIEDPVTGKKQLGYGEYLIDRLYNFQLNDQLKAMLDRKEIKKQTHNLFIKDYQRVISAVDQVGELMKIIMEKAILVKLLEYKESGKKWSVEHTRVFMEMMSREYFDKSRTGGRLLLNRKLPGWFGLTTAGGHLEPYMGVGSWTQEEAMEILAAVFNNVELFQKLEEK